MVISDEALSQANQTALFRGGMMAIVPTPGDFSNAVVHFSTGFQRRGRPSLGYPYIVVEEKSLFGTNWRSYRDVERALKKARPKPGEIKNLREFRGLSLGEWVLDRERNRIVMRTESDVAGAGKVEATSIGFLGKDKVIFLHCCERQAAMGETLPHFEKILASFQFEPGYAFEEKSDWGGVACGTVAVIAGVFLVWSRRLRKKKAAKAEPTE